MRSVLLLGIAALLLLSVVAWACDPAGGGINGVGDATTSSDGSATSSAGSAPATVSGTVKLEVTVTSETPVTGVDLYLDDQLLATLTTAPYTYDFDTTKYADGTHTMYAKIHSQDREDGATPTYTFNINNGTTSEGTAS